MNDQHDTDQKRGLRCDPLYSGEERRMAPQISDDQMEQIADKAAEKAVRKLTDEAYRSIGKSVTEKFFYIVGVLALAGYFWAQSKGWIK